jgi:hypothetical protein
VGAFANVDRRTPCLNQSAVIQGITDAFDDRLERYEVEHHAGTIELAFHDDRHLIVVSMQRFSLAVGKDQEMRRGKIEIIFSDFDAE